MASLQQDPSGNYHICFRFGSRRFKRSLKTRNRRKAEAANVRVEESIGLVESGRLIVPEDADIAAFLLSDGRLTGQVNAPTNIRLGRLFAEFQTSIPADSHEPESLRVAGVHMRHVVRILGGNKALRTVSNSDLQKFVTARSKEPGKRGTVSAGTIRKELATFGGLWSWAAMQGFVTGVFPKKGLVFPKQSSKPPFQTWSQIERQTDKAMSSEQAAILWDCLYLGCSEIGELLGHVQSQSAYEFLYPMCVLAAHTGARRSELCRSLVTDFDLEGGTVLLRERKRARSRRTTRMVPLSGTLRSVMTEWLGTKPPSRYSFPEDHRVIRTRKRRAEEGCVTPDEASHHLQQTLAGSRWEKIRGWHIFRHSFISNCASRGVDQRFIDAWVGHQTDEQRTRYRHLFPDSQQRALDAVFQ